MRRRLNRPVMGWAQLFVLGYTSTSVAVEDVPPLFILPLFYPLAYGTTSDNLTGMQQQFAVNSILTQSIDRLAFTDDFKQRAKQMNVQSIREAVVLSQRILESKPGFSNAWMDELTEYAAACGFLELLDNDSRCE